MNFKDRAIILSKNLIQENRYIITVFTETHGIYSGAVRQSSKKLNNNLAEGNLTDFLWNARLHEHLGYAKTETIKSYNSHILGNKTKLYAFNSIVSLLKLAFYEREPHNNLFPELLDFIHSMKQDFSIKQYFMLELAILAEAGYQLDLEKCAATDLRENLIYVSPKSGRAVSREAGKPYADKMLRLPQFLINNTEGVKQEFKEAYNLTSYFIKRYILINKPAPKIREDFFQHLFSVH